MIEWKANDSQLLSAYFVILPLRDEGAISLGLGNLPGLFAGSLLLTLVAAPVSTIIFSLPNVSKGRVRWKSFPREHSIFSFQRTISIWSSGVFNLEHGNFSATTSISILRDWSLAHDCPDIRRIGHRIRFSLSSLPPVTCAFLEFQALVLIHRFFSVSLLLFFVSWHASSAEHSGSSSKVRVEKLPLYGFFYFTGYQAQLCSYSSSSTTRCQSPILLPLKRTEIWMLVTAIMPILQDGVTMGGFIFLSEYRSSYGYKWDLKCVVLNYYIVVPLNPKI